MLWVSTSYASTSDARAIDASTRGGEASNTRGASTEQAYPGGRTRRYGRRPQAQATLDRMRDAVRAGRFDEVPTKDLTFEAFANLYLERYVKLRGLRSGKEIEQRLAVLTTRWQGKELVAIRVGEIEDLIHDLKAKGRRPATINRWLALLRHMFNWALGLEHVTQTPFRRGTQALISSNGKTIGASDVSHSKKKRGYSRRATRSFTCS